MSLLLGSLQAAEMVWPGMGAEIIFELYKSNKRVPRNSTANWHLRVLWNGQPLQTSTPLGTLDMIKVDDFMTVSPWRGFSEEHELTMRL